MDNDEYCSECGDRGWVEDLLSNAMGGRPWRYCDAQCPSSTRLKDKDSEKVLEKRQAEALKNKVTILGGDSIAVYLGEKQVCCCERYEMDVVLRSLGFVVDENVDWDGDFPERL